MECSTQLKYVDNILIIKGKVNFETANILLSEFQESFKPDIKEIDCSSMEKTDSAAISFLVACLRFAKKKNKKLVIKGMGEPLLKLVSLYDVNQILDISDVN